jgi:hypothetical protein
LASAWNNQSEAVKNNGARFRESRKAFIDTATAMGVPKAAAKALADQILDIPKSRAIKIAAETAAAKAAIAETQRRLDNMRDATVWINVLRKGDVGPAPRGDEYFDGADGGYTGNGRKHDVAGIVHRGEVVLPQEIVRRDWGMLSSRYGHLSGMDQAPGFAAGGLVGATHASRYDDPTVSLRRASEDTARSVRRVNDNLGPLGDNFQISTNIIQGNVRELKASIREMAKQTEMLKKIRDAERDRLKDLKDQRKSLADATAANFKPDAFGQIDLAAAAMSGQFGTAFGDQALAFANRGVDPAEQVQMFKDLSQEQIAAYLATLTATQRAEMENSVRFDALNNQMLDAAHFTEALEQAVANGLDGALFQQLATSGNVGAAQLFAGFTAEQIASYEQQFNNANLQATNAGQFAGQAEYGAAIRAQTLVTQEANQIAREALQTQRRNEKRLEKLESILEKAPRDTGREVGKALDDVAAGGRRRP